jgi:hypothetical protein
MNDIEYGEQEKLHDEWWESEGRETARIYGARFAARVARMQGIAIGVSMQTASEQPLDDDTELRKACTNLLDGINERHQGKMEDVFTCPDMQRIYDLMHDNTEEQA